eukprot:COSAG01_NODE_2496_length_7573_cov_15.650120_2_plen_74_part_00
MTALVSALVSVTTAAMSEVFGPSACIALTGNQYMYAITWNSSAAPGTPDGKGTDEQDGGLFGSGHLDVRQYQE